MNALHLAIKELNDSQLEWLLEHGADEGINLQDMEGNTPLMLAVSAHLEDRYFKQLLAYDVDLQIRNKQGMTALMLALDHHNLHAVKVLLDWMQRKGGQVQVEASIEQGRIALFFATFQNDPLAVQALLRAGVDVNVRNLWARTPLMLASESGYEDVLQTLLKNEAEVSLADHRGEVALSLAAGEGHTSCIRLLLQSGADPNVRSDQGYTPLISAAFGSNSLEVVRLLLEHGAEVHARTTEGATALSQAAWMGHEEIVSLLLEWGAGEDQRDLQSAFRGAYLDNGMNTAPLLQLAGATIGLLEAISRQNVDEVEYYLRIEKGDVNAVRPHGYTPLIMAVYDGCLSYYHKPSVEIIRMLLEQGADVNARTTGGTTALLDAAYFADEAIETLLMEHGADVNVVGKPSCCLDDAETPLTISPCRDHIGALREMIERGTDVNAQTRKGQTALMRTSQYGSQDVVTLLLENGADVHLHDVQGRTALMYAVLGGTTEIVTLLLAHGAEADLAHYKRHRQRGNSSAQRPSWLRLAPGRDPDEESALSQYDRQGKEDFP